MDQAVLQGIHLHSAGVDGVEQEAGWSSIIDRYYLLEYKVS
jgi:hypothetical protein